jgi:hypothetical protein
MSESRKIQASIQSPQIIRQPIDALAFMRRYDNIAESRQRLLNYQRVKVPPSELVKLKLKKKATKLKRTTNLKGEVAKNIIEQKKFEKGQKREKPEQDITIVGEPAPPVNIYQQPAPGGLQFDPAIERQRLALEDRRRQDDYNLAQRKLVIEATNYDINKALADREYDLQNRRLQIEDRNRQVEIQALFDRQQEEIRQFDILQEQRRKDRKLEKRLRLEELEAAEERFDRERQLQEEARRQFEESRVIRLPAGREQELQSQTRFLPGGGPPPIPEGGFANPIAELPGRRPGSTAAVVSAEQQPTLSRREQPSELVRQAARVQANIDSRLNEFQREEDQRRAQREAQFLTRGLSQVDDLIQRRFSELEQRQQQAQRAALEPDLSAEEQEQVRHRIYDSILEGLQPQGVLAQQIEGEVNSAAEDLREAQRLENQQLRAEILDRQQGLITAPQLEDQLRREQAERARLEQRLATIETDVASIQTPRSTPTSTPGTSPGDIATEFEEIRRSQLESSGSEAGSLGTSGSELIFQLEEGEEEQEPVAEEPGIATRAAQTVGETLAAGGQFIADYFQAPEQVAEQETRGIGRPLSFMERAVQGIEERKKQARRPQPGEQTGGALVDAEGNPIYGLGQDFPEEFQEEIEIAEAQLAAKQRSDEEQRQILAAAKAAEEQRKQQLRKAEQEAEAKARRIAKAEETAKRRDEELAQIREARLAQERSDLEQRAGGVLPEPAPEAPAPQVRKAKPLVKPPTQPTGEVVRQVKPPSPVRVETSADVELTPERYQQLFRENKDILETNLIVNQAVYKEEFADKFEEERLRLLKQYVDKLITDGKILEKDKQLVSDVVINSKVLTPAVRDKVLFSEQEVNRGATIYLDKNRDKDLFKRSDEFKQELNEQKTLLRDATDRLEEDNYDFQSKQAALNYLDFMKKNKAIEVLKAQRGAKPVARGQVEDVAEEPTRRAQVATEGEALVEEAQGAGTEPQSAIRTNFTTYQSLLPEIQQLNQVGRPKAQRQDKIYIKNTSDKTLRGLEPGQETLITGYESQNNGTLGFFTEGKRKRTQKNVIEKLIKEGKIKIYKK